MLRFRIRDVFQMLSHVPSPFSSFHNTFFSFITITTATITTITTAFTIVYLLFPYIHGQGFVKSSKVSLTRFDFDSFVFFVVPSFSLCTLCTRNLCFFTISEWINFVFCFQVYLTTDTWKDLFIKSSLYMACVKEIIRISKILSIYAYESLIHINEKVCFFFLFNTPIHLNTPIYIFVKFTILCIRFLKIFFQN